MFKMVVLLTPTVKTVIKPEELKSVFNVLPLPSESSPSHNTLVFASKVTTMTRESASHALQVVLNAPMPLHVKDVQFQPLTTTTALVHALKATSLLLSH